jgi:transcriptional regulator with XRE-family HTH domain
LYSALSVRVRFTVPRFVASITKRATAFHGVHGIARESDAPRRRKNCSGRVPAMSERDTFGPRLRSERERRGISLETIAAVTNVGIELWQGLERNDFSRWPTGIFARAFVRDYARAVGLDSDEVVDEFCRLFSVGDRRASRIIRAQAELIGKVPEYEDDTAIIPGGVDRRSSSQAAVVEPPPARIRLVPRTVAATLDAMAVVATAGLAALVVPIGFWASVAVTAIIYYTAGTVLTGSSPGTRATDVLRQRIPTLFVQDRRAPA